VAGADDAGAGVAEELLDGLGQVADGRSVRLLDEEIAGVCVLKGKHDKGHGLVEIHHETGHIGVRDRNRVAVSDLFAEQRDDGAPAAHDVSVAGAAEGRAVVGRPFRVRIDDPLGHGLRNPHGVDGVSGLVRREKDDALHPVLYRGLDDIVRTFDIRPVGLHGEEFAGRHFLQGRSVKDEVDPLRRRQDGLPVADIADIEFHLVEILRVIGLQFVPHVVLLLLIS